MKNIYIIPTDKPSSLFIIDKSKMLLSKPPYLSFTKVGGKVHKVEGSKLYQPQCVYITSDEKIKEGDWAIYHSGEVIQYLVKLNTDNLKKVILTTDLELIADGVQAIDDEFLQWFVNNPSCEFVDIELSNWNSWEEYVANQSLIKPKYQRHKIIIPQEEPKQDYSGVHLRHCYQGEYEDGCKYGENDCPAKPLEPKQGILEEVAKIFKNDRVAHGYDITYENGFIDAAIWQTEKLYTEEDMIEFAKYCNLKDGTSVRELLVILFEQFKKK